MEDMTWPEGENRDVSLHSCWPRGPCLPDKCPCRSLPPLFTYPVSKVQSVKGARMQWRCEPQARQVCITSLS